MKTNKNTGVSPPGVSVPLLTASTDFFLVLVLWGAH